MKRDNGWWIDKESGATISAADFSEEEAISILEQVLMCWTTNRKRSSGNLLISVNGQKFYVAISRRLTVELPFNYSGQKVRTTNRDEVISLERY